MEKMKTRNDYSNLTNEQVRDKYLEAKRWASYDNLAQKESDRWSLLRDDCETEMINREMKY